MNKKFELLKELLLLREAGGSDSLDKSISLTIDVYCEGANINRDEFIDSLRKIYNLVWSNSYKDTKEWWNKQQTYKMLLNNLEVA
jgi:hypothetical protein